MTKNRPAAKSPSTAIARVLKGLGLKQGADFRVRGQYANGERTGTYVAVLTKEADQVIADHADEIEESVQLDGGFTFRVSIHFTAGGRMWTWIANYGERTRDAAPVATADADGAALDTASRRVALATGRKIVGGPATLPGYKAKLGASRPAFEQPTTFVVPAAPDAVPYAAPVVDPFETPAVEHPYEGLAQRPFGSLTWACEEAGQVWFFQNTSSSTRYTLKLSRSRTEINGWYLSGDRVGRAFMGATLTIAATAAQPVILLADKLARIAQQWPEGTRVSYPNNRGITVTGTVNGYDVGSVTITTHENFGRTYVGVTADPIDSIPWGQRERPFTDLLTRI